MQLLANLHLSHRAQYSLQLDVAIVALGVALDTMPPSRSRSRSHGRGCTLGAYSIYCKPKRGMRFLLNVKASDTINQVKVKIHEHMAARRTDDDSTETSDDPLPPEMLQLSLGRVQMVEPDRTLGSYGIGHLSLVRFRWNDDVEYYSTT